MFHNLKRMLSSEKLIFLVFLSWKERKSVEREGTQVKIMDYLQIEMDGGKKLQ